MDTLPPSTQAWLKRLTCEPSVPFGSLIAQNIAAGRITRICDCGCRSFDLSVSKEPQIPPLVEPNGHGGAFFEAVFASSSGEPISFLVFADSRGYLGGIDITLGGNNHAPVPSDTELGELLYVTDIRRGSGNAL